jgi:hypothetical protein
MNARQVQKHRYGLAGFPIFKQQNCIWPTRNAIVLSLTAHAGYKLLSL